jgi:chemosensory pili system protein ChpA (sensor histidine kinase/response regulator)
VLDEPSLELDLGPISWVQSEIEESLKRALESLKTFQATPSDVLALERARTHVHQVAGAIQMVGLEAVVAFINEIELHLAQLQEKRPRALRKACEVIERACNRLSIFLADLADGELPVPLKLYPEYAALQAARGVTVTLTDLFYPDLSASVPGTAPRESIASNRLPSYLVKQRRLYQRGLLAWLGGDEEGSRTMRDAIASIEHVTTHSGLRSFWWTVGALFEALAMQGVDGGHGVKQLAARVDLQIRRVVEGSGKAADRLRREVLYYVAISAPVGPQVQAVQRAFRLAGLVPTPDMVRADAVTMRSLARSARDQLGVAKDAWVKLASGHAESLDRLSQALSSVHASAVEMKRDALTTLAGSLVGRLDHLPKGEILEPLATEFATALLLAESALENRSKLAPDFAEQVAAMLARLDAAGAGRFPTSDGGQVVGNLNKRSLLAQVSREIHENLRHVEDVLDVFFRDHNKRAELASLGEDINQIRGALRILSLDGADQLMALCGEQINAYANPTTPVSAEDLELLAESLAGLGLYIQSVEQQRADCDHFVAPFLAKRLEQAAVQAVEETASVE